MITKNEHLVLSDHLANTRDLGGMVTTTNHRIKRQRLLRTAALSPVSPTTAALLTAEVGTGVYVDLRTEGEIAKSGEPTALLELGWRWHPAPLQTKHSGDTDDSPDGFLRRYLDHIPAHLDAIEAVIKVLGEHPTIVGCAAGKDRTGLVIAGILTGLGVPRATVLADYELSTSCLRGHHSSDKNRTWVLPKVPEPAYAHVIDTVLTQIDPAVFTAQADKVRHLLLEENL